jgi:hypothetical protein
VLEMNLYLLGHEVNAFLDFFLVQVYGDSMTVTEKHPTDASDSSDAGSLLSSLGAAKGGEARARKLSPERRREIAQAAVEARWAKAGKKPLPRASHTGELKLGKITIPCAVLEDGTRVLWQQGFLRAIGRTGRAAESAIKDEDESLQLPVFLRADNLKSLISSELLEASKPIPFRGSGIISARGGVAYGYKAELLPQVCTVFLDAADEDLLRPNQRHIYRQCKLLVRGLAVVGITALIDEATGFQDDRAKNALAKILEQFIAKELRPYVKTFPADFYKEMFRLRQWKWPELPADQRKRPILVGNLTDNVVYDRLAPGVKQRLKELIGRDESGRLKKKMFQRLTEEIGDPKLKEHLASVVALMKAADTWPQFIAMIDRALPKYKPLPLFDPPELEA